MHRLPSASLPPRSNSPGRGFLERYDTRGTPDRLPEGPPGQRNPLVHAAEILYAHPARQPSKQLSGAEDKEKVLGELLDGGMLHRRLAAEGVRYPEQGGLNSRQESGYEASGEGSEALG